jgi:hypothetical protein
LDPYARGEHLYGTLDWISPAVGGPIGTFGCGRSMHHLGRVKAA